MAFYWTQQGVVNFPIVTWVVNFLNNAYYWTQPTNSIFLLHQISQQYFQPWLISQTSPYEHGLGVSMRARITCGQSRPTSKQQWHERC